MTALQLYESVLVELNKVKAPSLSLSDFVYFFNKATQQYLNEIYNTYEINQQKVDDLRTVRGTAKIQLNKTDDYDDIELYDAVYEAYLPDDYFHILNCIVEYKIINTNKCLKQELRVFYGAKRLNSNASPLVINNFYLKPSYKNPYYYINTVNIGNLIGESDVINNLDSEAKLFSLDLSDIKNFTNVTSGKQFTLEFRFQDKQSIFIPFTMNTTDSLVDLYRELNKVKNKKQELQSLYIDFESELILNISLLGCLSIYFKEYGPRGKSMDVLTYLNIDLLVNKTSDVRYGNRSKSRIEIRYGNASQNILPQRIIVDYLKTPQYIILSPELVEDIEDNSQIIEFPDYVVYEIINKLVTLIMENSGNPRVQSMIGVNQSIASGIQKK